MAPIIRIENLHHTYRTPGQPPVPALQGVNFTLEPGEFVVILGHNGSGKSTLARHLNALLLPSEGDVWVKAWNSRQNKHWLDIRRTVGMVFQQPDNQIVATVVEEDIAFGPENLGLPRAEIVRRVEWALGRVEMESFRQRAPHQLSGGQKQRVCIAGVLAMQPEVLVLDEATAMLDPEGRGEVMELARRLNQEQGTTVVAVTHFMHEAIHADRVIVMEAGRIVLEGSPRAIFTQPARIRALHLDLPPAAELGLRLHEQCPDFPAGMLTAEEVADALIALLGAGHTGAGLPAAELSVAEPAASALPPLPAPHGEQVISVTELGHFYMEGTPLAVRAIGGVNFDVRRGEVLGILGHTGSGKSTAVQHLNGLMRPQEGDVVVFGQSLKTPQLNLRAIRRRVGLVFQFPEAQLFEQFVGDDIAYGPRNLKLSAEEIRERVRRAMAAVELPFAEFKDRMTFGLSGGQKRRVALAGVLALEPEVLVLDEPTAGLDPQARRHLLERLVALRAQGITLVMISHNMDELAELCDRLVVFAGGATVNHGTPAEIFGRPAALKALGLGVPEVTQVAARLIAAGLLPAGATIYTLAQAEAAIGPLLPQSTNQPIS